MSCKSDLKNCRNSVLNRTVCNEPIIGHIDIDCFECQVLIKQNPHLRGLPCAAVSSDEKHRENFNSVNYEARSFGITKFTPVETALGLCPPLIMISLPRGKSGGADLTLLKDSASDVFKAIKSFTNEAFQERTYFLRFSPHDEFYVDLTSEVGQEEDITTRLKVGCSLMKQMVDHIFTETGFTCSAGVSTSSFRAKMAVEQDRPYGVSILHPEDWDTFLGSREITSVPGLKKTLGKRLVDRFEVRLMKELKLIPDNILVEMGGLKSKDLRTIHCIYSGDCGE